MKLYTRTCFFRHSTYFTELCVENNTTPLRLGSLAGSALAVEMSIRNERHAELTFSVTTKSLNRRTRKRNELHEHFL